MTHDVLQCFFFLVDRRDPRVFKGWKAVDIFKEIIRARAERTILFAKNKDGELTGVVLGKLEDTNMHIPAILANPRMMLRFYRVFRAKWPQVTTLTATRRGKAKTYTIKQLDRRLNHG